jgi:hypothetical protein
MFLLAVDHAGGGDEPERRETGREVVGFDLADEMVAFEEGELGDDVGFLAVDFLADELVEHRGAAAKGLDSVEVLEKGDAEVAELFRFHKRASTVS